jgi:CRISPR/Cas system-associated exonuclease Cas4 (RecB family)
MTVGELADEITTDLAAVFEEGKDQEVVTRRYLSELGFEIKKAGFTETMDNLGISGQVDGTLEVNGNRYIVEIKTVSEYAWDSLNEPKDFNESYYKKWYGQMQIYLLLFNYEKGLFILKRKQAKQVKIIEVALDYDYAENLLKKAETVNEALKITTAPPFLHGNPVECRRCPFFSKVCNPPMDFGETQIIEDEVLAGKLARRDELVSLVSEYNKLDKEAKERFREIPAAICGDFSITGKAGIIKRAAQEAKEIPTWTTKIEKIDVK